MEKISKISSFWKKLQMSQGFGKFFVASDLILKKKDVFRVENKAQIVFQLTSCWDTDTKLWMENRLFHNFLSK